MKPPQTPPPHLTPRSLAFIGKGVQSVWRKGRACFRNPWLQSGLMVAFLAGYVALPVKQGFDDHAARMAMVKKIEATQPWTFATMPHRDIIEHLRPLERHIDGPNHWSQRLVLQSFRSITDAWHFSRNDLQILTAAAKIYEQAGLDPDYLEAFRERREDWHNWLAHDERVTGLKEIWPELSNGQRILVLQEILDKHSEIYGFQPSRVTIYDSSDEKECGEDVSDRKRNRTRCDAYTLGYYAHSQRLTSINIADRDAWDDFAAMLSTAVHENYHGHQGQLADRVRGNMIKTTDPIWTQAELFRINGNLYARSEQVGYIAYQRQFMERESWQADADLTRIFGKTASESHHHHHERSAPPPDTRAYQPNF